MADRDSLVTATQRDLENARTKGQMIGWAQGAGAVLVFGMAVKLLGWLPLIGLVAVGGYVLYRLTRRRPSS